jgi:hypothetical protein
MADTFPYGPTAVDDTLPIKSLGPCAIVVPGVSNHIKVTADGVSWLFTDDGAFSEDFKAMLCAIPCFHVPPQQ